MPSKAAAQCLLFRVGDQRFAIRASDIVVVVPLPRLQTIAAAPAHVAGLFRYQGVLIAVIDLTRLSQNRSALPHFSSRVILVRTADGSLLGLLAEQATDIQSLAIEQPLNEVITGDARTGLAPLVFDTTEGLVQLVDWQALLTPELQSLTSANG
jgi:chemotaxis-related protein WspB